MHNAGREYFEGNTPHLIAGMFEKNIENSSETF
jgi:hypothetical protein